MKTALVCGSGGFIGGHLVKRLKHEGFWVRGVDLKFNEFSPSPADDFVIGDLRDQYFCKNIFDRNFDEVYQLAADMGGIRFILNGENDADIMHNSAAINLNILNITQKNQKENNGKNIGKIFYSSSACIYPEHNQLDPENPICSEESAYPANPDSEYGWEKLFSERLYLSYKKCYGINVKIARYHNIFGPEGTYEGGREKSPAALCRKIILAKDGEEIEVWGDGKQTRSFLYIDECLEGSIKLMRSNFSGPVNIGSEEMISISDLAQMIIEISGKKLQIKYIPGPVGVKGRNSDNNLIAEKLGWKPNSPLREGIEKTYRWIESQISKNLQSQ